MTSRFLGDPGSREAEPPGSLPFAFGLPLFGRLSPCLAPEGKRMGKHT